MTTTEPTLALEEIRIGIARTSIKSYNQCNGALADQHHNVYLTEGCVACADIVLQAQANHPYICR